MDLGSTLIACTEREPSALALVDGATRLSYESTLLQATSIARGLNKRGVIAGSHLVVALQNRIEMALLHWACQLAGIVVTPINWRSSADDLEFVLENANAQALVFEPATSNAVSNSHRARATIKWQVSGDP